MEKVKKAEIILIEKDPKFAVNSAISIYKCGGVFIYPTDTIYGIGGNPFNNKTVNKIIEIKGRQKNQKFIFLIKDLTLLKDFVNVEEKRLSGFLKKIWPAPVSIILELRKEMTGLFGSLNAAFRIPDNKFCSNLLDRLNAPLISTSANKTDQNPISNKKIISKEFGYSVDSIFFTKHKSRNIASTIIDLTGEKPVLIREGVIKFEAILEQFYSRIIYP